MDDELLIRRFEQFQQFRRAFVLTPGDNDWTDCHRTSNGTYLPTERLDFLRELFYPHPNRTTGGRPFRVFPQSRIAGFEQFVENTLFRKNRVVFSQIHVVGSSNNLRPWNQLDPNDTAENPPADRLQEYTERNAASLDWLQRTFDMAERRRAPGIFITIHADPNFDRVAEDRTGFNDFLNALFEHTRDFAKPVVLAHGDSHIFRVDTLD